MSEYIKREDVLARKGNCYDKDGHLLYAVGTGDIMRVPTADVVSREDYESMERTVDLLNKALQKSVEVVRCKDCKHHEELLNNNNGDVLCWVHDIDVVVDRNGYCNYGKRKEQEHEKQD